MLEVQRYLDNGLKASPGKALQDFQPKLGPDKLPISQHCVCQRSHFWKAYLLVHAYCLQHHRI